MNNNNILQSLKEQLDRGSLTLDDAALGADLAGLLGKAFSGTVLELEDVKLNNAGEDRLHFRALSKSLLGVILQPVKGIFFVQNDHPELLLKAVLPTVWDFSWSYPDLPDYTNFGLPDSEAGNRASFFYDLRFPAEKPMTMVFTSCDFIEEGKPKSYLKQLDPALDAARLRKGLNFISEIALSELPFLKTLADFADFKKELNLPFYGRLDHKEGYDEIRLEVALNFNKGYEDIFHIGVSSLVLYTGTSLYADYTGSGISFLGGVAVGSSQSSPGNIELQWPIGSTQLIIRNTGPLSFPGFNTFKTLLKDHLPDESGSFPMEISSLGSLEIRELSLHLSLAPPGISHIAMSVGPARDWSYELLKEVLTIEDLLLRWEVVPGNPDPVRFYILSDFKAGDGLVHLSAEFPDFAFYGELGIKQTIELDRILQKVAPHAHLPKLSVLDLALSADIKQGLYAFEIDMASDWELETGGKSILRLERLTLELEKSPHWTFAAINGVLAIAGVDIILLATNAGESDGGWLFSGSTRPGNSIPVGEMVRDFIDLFGEFTLPGVLDSLVIENIGVSFNTGDNNFSFNCESALQIESGEVRTQLFMELGKTAGNTLSANILFGDSIEFKTRFKDAGKSSSLIATLDLDKEEAGFSFSPGEYLQDLLPSGSFQIPQNLSIELKKAVFLLLKDDKRTRFLLGANLDLEFTLKELPLIGSAIPFEGGIEGLDILVASRVIKENELNKLDIEGLPGKDIPGGLLITARFRLGDETQTFELALATEDAALNVSGSAITETADGPDGARIKQKWFDIDKSVGPVTIHRAGLKYDSTAASPGLLVMVDSSIAVGPAAFRLIGLGMGSPLDEPKFLLQLDGLDLAYKSGPVEIGGMFYKEPGKLSYLGSAVIRAKTFNIVAYGGYNAENADPSFFLYAVYNKEMGGPSFLFVTGLSAGLGINRRIIVPPVEGLESFPLVKAAMKDADGDGSSLIEKLSEHLPVSPGNMWLALGVRFTSFKLMESFALLTVKLGDEFRMDLLGISTLRVPAKGSTNVYARMLLKASFTPESGVMGIEARLTSESYVFQRNCKISGGFAFYQWFGNSPHAGDFVVTWGGYHPSYDKPGHFPLVPRLSLNWTISPELKVKGTAYMAITPNALMAGGRLEAVFQKGSIRAWFNLDAHFIIFWSPFTYRGEFGVSIGASFTIRIAFVKVRITISLFVGVKVWGPDFSGRAIIDLDVISFTIPFGNASPKTRTLSYGEFVSSMLPEDLISVSPLAGLLRDLEAESKNKVNHGKVSSGLSWVIDPQYFIIEISFAIPYNRFPDEKDELKEPGFNIRPAGLSAEKIGSTVSCSLTGPAATIKTEPVAGKAPGALWGKLQFNPLEEDGLVDVYNKIRLSPGTSTPGETREFYLDELLYDSKFNELVKSIWQQRVLDLAVTKRVNEKDMNKINDKSRKSERAAIINDFNSMEGFAGSLTAPKNIRLKSLEKYREGRFWDWPYKYKSA